MIHGAVGHLDVAQLVLYAFFFFFAGLIWYLRREDRREGYPLDSEQDGGVKERGFLLIPTPKSFNFASGVSVQAPNFVADTRHNSTKVEVWPGSPYEPVGDPLLAGVGPGSYAMRPDVPEKNFEGHDLILPLRVATNFAVAEEGGNPLGFAVVGADLKIAGVIKDVWVDTAESILRYYEVGLSNGGPSVLAPVYFCDVNFKARRVKVNALLAGSFANVPALKLPDSITMLEEEKISAYYGAGTLYSTAERSEPVL